MPREPERVAVRIRTVEYDRKTAAFIAKALQEGGFAVDAMRDGDDAVETTPFDAVGLGIKREALSVSKPMRAHRNEAHPEARRTPACRRIQPRTCSEDSAHSWVTHSKFRNRK